MYFRKSPRGHHPAKGCRFRFGQTILGLAAIATLSAMAQSGRQSSGPNPDRPYLLSAANRLPDANDQMEMRQQQQAQQDFENANAQRRKELTDESAELLKLAADLKKEMDKTDKDTLSLEVIRKADEIEKLAKDVKTKMKLTVGQG
jgi:hypothetical protein